MAELKRIQIFKGCLIQSLTKTTHRYQLFIHLKRFDNKYFNNAAVISVTTCNATNRRAVSTVLSCCYYNRYSK